MSERRWLVLRLAAPLMSFGTVAVDHVGPTGRWPGRSMLTGLIANALGWDWTDRDAHQRLQDRIVHGALEMAPGDDLTDMQNARLGKNDRGWTTWGTTEGRTGASYDAPHRRRRDFRADAEVIAVLTLEPEAEMPTLDEVAAALDRPARPLFIGRKPCLPSGPILRGEMEAADVHGALATLAVDGAHDAAWPAGEGPPGDRTFDEADLRVWSSGLHGGTRRVVEGRL